MQSLQLQLSSHFCVWVFLCTNIANGLYADRVHADSSCRTRAISIYADHIHRRLPTQDPPREPSNAATEETDCGGPCARAERRGRVRAACGEARRVGSQARPRPADRAEKACRPGWKEARASQLRYQTSRGETRRGSIEAGHAGGAGRICACPKEEQEDQEGESIGDRVVALVLRSSASMATHALILLRKQGDKEAVDDGEKKEPRGVVYLGHIPHGFFERQMRCTCRVCRSCIALGSSMCDSFPDAILDFMPLYSLLTRASRAAAYFSQFGKVTRLRLSRSKKVRIVCVCVFVVCLSLAIIHLHLLRS